MHFTQLSDMAGGYWFFRRYSVRGVAGYVYHMERRLSEMERKSMERYGNVQIFSGSVKSVPERRFDVVFLGDRCWTAGELAQGVLAFKD